MPARHRSMEVMGCCAEPGAGAGLSLAALLRAGRAAAELGPGKVRSGPARGRAARPADSTRPAPWSAGWSSFGPVPSLCHGEGKEQETALSG